MPSPFDEFLSWLSPDREEAARRYEELRKKLIRFFTWKHCHTPEELVDESLDRAARKIAAGAVDRSGDPFGYCYVVATYVLKEYRKRAKPEQIENHDDFINPEHKPRFSEDEAACMDQCLARMKQQDRDLFARWFQCNKGREKIETHRKMAEEKGSMSALRTWICRTKEKLRECVEACLKEKERKRLQ